MGLREQGRVRVLGHSAGSAAIIVRVKRHGVDEILLGVEDTGVGFAARIANDGEYGYGLTIVDALVRRHDGTLRVRNDRGGVIEIIVPKQGSETSVRTNSFGGREIEP